VIRFAIVLTLPLFLALTSCSDGEAEQRISDLQASLTKTEQEKKDLQAKLDPLEEELGELKEAIEAAEIQRELAGEVAGQEDEAAESQIEELQAYIQQLEGYLEQQKLTSQENMEGMRRAYEARCNDIGRKQGSIEVALRTYRDVTFRQFTENGVVIKHAEGLLNVPYEKLPDSLQQRYLYQPQELELTPAKGGVKLPQP